MAQFNDNQFYLHPRFMPEHPDPLWVKDANYVVPVVSPVGAGPKGAKGDQGDPFEFEDFTEEQLGIITSKVTAVTNRTQDAVVTTTVDGTTVIEIPFAYDEFDMLFVDVNGLDLAEGDDYTIVDSSISLVTSLPAGQEVHFRALKYQLADGDKTINVTDDRKDYDTVAAMQADTTLAAGDICHTLGFHSAGDGGAAYYKIASSGTANGIDIIACGNSYANLIYSDNSVNVLQLGAYGDNANDDYNVINYAAQVAYIIGYNLVFPKVANGYLSETPIVIENAVNIEMNSPIIYNGIGTALTVGKAGTAWMNKKVKLMVSSDSTTYQTGSIGLRLLNFNTCDIEIPLANNFETGILCEGNNAGFGYNTVLLGLIENAVNLLKLYAGESSGWCNENVFIGGRFVTFSDSAYKGSNIGVTFDAASGNTHAPNANLFIKPSLEGLDICVNVLNGSYNKFILARTEAATTALVTNNGCVFNTLEVSYGVSLATLAESITNSVIDQKEMKPDLFNKLVFDSGFIPSYSFSNDNYLSCGKDLGYISSANGTIGQVYKGVKHNDYISFPTAARHIGVFIDTSITKEFYVIADIVNSSSGYRPALVLFDSSDNVITDADAVKGLSNRPFSFSAAGSAISGVGCYTIGSNISDGAYFQVPSNCVKAFVLIKSVTDGLRGFKIYAKRYAKSASVLGNKVQPGLSAIPTCEGFTGDFCFNSGSSSSVLGWRYNGSSWDAVSV